MVFTTKYLIYRGGLELIPYALLHSHAYQWQINFRNTRSTMLSPPD